MIYFNGDSNVAGSELADPDLGMTGVLSRLLGLPYENHAFGGASNDRIYDTTMQALFDRSTNKPQLRQRPDLVVIGWTQFSRIQWFLVDEWNSGEFWEVNNLGVGIPIPPEYQARYEFWKTDIRHDGNWDAVLGKYWHNKIFNLHCLLDYFAIPHVFFNAFQCFLRHGLTLDQQDWQGRFMAPYDDSLCYVPWCFRQGYQEITPGWNHFREDAQAAWAEIMHDHIRQHRIL